MTSREIAKLLRTKSQRYVVKDYNAKKKPSSSRWSKFGLPAEIIQDKTNEFKIIDGFTSFSECFTTFVFRSGPSTQVPKILPTMTIQRKTQIRQLFMKYAYINPQKFR